MYLALNEVLESIDVIHKHCNLLENKKIGDKDIATDLLTIANEELQFIHNRMHEDIGYINIKSMLDSHTAGLIKNRDELIEDWHDNQKFISSPNESYAARILNQNARKTIGRNPPILH